MRFESELNQGKFVISECTKCNKIIWPPNEICNSCFGEARWKEGPNQGKILEFSKKDETVFCLVEFGEVVRLIGTLEETMNPEIGQGVKIKHCSIENGDYSFKLSLI
jgi:uncharacterized OB-fold protein